MSITPIEITLSAPGTFQATAEPVGSVLPAGAIPQWTSSDVTIATVASPNPDATGMTTVLTGVATGTITLTVAVTKTNGKIAQGQIAVPVAAGEVLSFVISQIA